MLCELFDHARLADAWFTDEHDQSAAAGARIGELRLDARQLVVAADERRAAEHQAGLLGLVDDFARGDWRGEALQFEFAEIAERERLTAGEQRLDDGAAEDLAGTRAIAQPARGHDSGAEVVAFVAQRVAGVDADADGDALASDGAARRLLHRDRTAYGISGGRERHHEAVAERLHLGAAVGADGITQELVVSFEDALGVVVAGALHQLGGADEVGEEDGCGGSAFGGHRVGECSRGVVVGLRSSVVGNVHREGREGWWRILWGRGTYAEGWCGDVDLTPTLSARRRGRCERSLCVEAGGHSGARAGATGCLLRRLDARLYSDWAVTHKRTGCLLDAVVDGRGARAPRGSGLSSATMHHLAHPTRTLGLCASVVNRPRRPTTDDRRPTTASTAPPSPARMRCATRGRRRLRDLRGRCR